MVRLGAYWDSMERRPTMFDAAELDWQVEAAERAGKHIILCLGAVKTFGYPECFVPAHYMAEPIRERRLVDPGDHPALLRGATAFVSRVVERYRNCPAIIAWQVEHEAIDPLGMEHSWRLSVEFVRREVEAVRIADSTRPIMMNGFLPTSTPVRLHQRWRTRDQGDSLSAAHELADIVGIDFYPRHALAGIAGRTLYLDGSRRPWQQHRRKQLLSRAARGGGPIMIAEGQAEPWEAVTTPPSPSRRGMYSCLPEHVIENYNQCMGWTWPGPSRLWAYLFWGAEYWVLREQQGDPEYIAAFRRVLEPG